MNRIEKAEWAARRPGGSEEPSSSRAGGRAGAAVRAFQAGRCIPARSRQPGWGSPSRARRWGRPVGAPHPLRLLSICWLCRFLSIADPFSAPSVISNNVTASLESIHQSRRKPVLTLIKKKYHLCLAGMSSPCPRHFSRVEGRLAGGHLFPPGLAPHSEGDLDPCSLASLGFFPP